MKKLILIILAFSPFLLFAQITLIPDANFEQQLLEEGIDSDGLINHQVYTSDISTVVSLVLDNKSIADLTGIDDFISLVTLSCSDNSLTSIDLSGNLDLEHLTINSNQLSDLDLTNNVNLRALNCGENLLTNLDLSTNTSLEVLSCNNNRLSRLDLSLHQSLNYLYCLNNYLVSLRVDNGNNSILSQLGAYSNPHLHCIQVDDAATATVGGGPYSTWTKDPATIYSEGCPDVTYIPDVFFELRLISLGIDSDGVLNNRVFTSDISGVVALDLTTAGISDITGIEDFTSLSVINCESNNLTALDFSKNKALVQLNCTKNNLEAIDVSQNTELVYFWCNENMELKSIDVSQNTKLSALTFPETKISSLDVSNNTLLTTIWCDDTPITHLDISSNPNISLLHCRGTDLINLNLKNGNNLVLTDMYATSNAKLFCIQVDDATAATSGTGSYSLWVKDPTATYSEGCPDVTYIPDANFEQAMIDQGIDSDGTINHQVFTSDISMVTTLIIDSKNIIDLTGIEGFGSLNVLDCSGNKLTSLDLRYNPGLTVLDCQWNQISFLNVSQNVSLTELQCRGNSLSSLDVSQNTAITHLDCRANGIANLDMINNTILEELTCGSNPLLFLDVSQNILLTKLVCDHNKLSNLDLSQNINLIHLNCFRNLLVNLDLSNNPVLEYLFCGDNLINSLNISNNLRLTFLDCSENLISVLDVSNQTLLEYLGCALNQIIALDLTGNPALHTLICTSNPITSLDVGQNPMLEILTIFGTNVSLLDVSQNPALSELISGSDNLITLDLSNNPNLTKLICLDDQLISLNVKNGNNTSLTIFDASLNPGLSCIEVDDAVAANAGTGVYTTWVKDPLAAYSEGCPGYTYVPDPFFEQALIDQGIDSEGVHNQYVLTSDISVLTALNVSGLGISDLTGIEDFTSLTHLNCEGNLLAGIDLSQNTNLSNLEIGSNQLLGLDLSFNPLLDHLRCVNNQLTSLDLSFNPNLTHLDASSNEISFIDLSFSLLLEVLFFENNLLTSLDLSQNISLTTMVCHSNYLMDLDLSQNSNLAQVWCFDNDLSSLNVQNGFNHLLTNFDATGNPFLTCIKIDNELDAAAGLGVYGLWAIDLTASYSESCSGALVFRPLISGWTWFSINVQAPDMSLDVVLANLNLNDGDYIKSSAESSTYYATYGWFGDLSTINVEETYKIKLANPGTILFEGAPVDPSLTPIPIGTGWNWIGYVPEGSLPLDDALASLWPMNNDYIKSQSASATFYDGYGWFGDLSAMDPLEGYMLKSGKDEALTYPAGMMKPLAQKSRLSEVAGSGFRVAGCGLRVAGFEYSGQVTAEVLINGEISGEEGDLLLTMSEGRVVGQSGPMVFPPTGLPIFNHLAYENSINDRKLEFYYFDADNNQWFKFEETINFNADMIEADAFKPFRLEKASMINDPTSDIRHLTSLKVFPNPVSNYLTINLELPNDRKVTLQILDALGRVVDEIQAGTLEAGNHQLTHDMRSLKQGNYLIRLKHYPEISQRIIITH